MVALGCDAGAAHIARVMRHPAAEMTAGRHGAWTTAAVISQWRPLEPWQRLTFETSGLTMADVVPTILLESGFVQDSEGVWLLPSAAEGRDRIGCA